MKKFKRYLTSTSFLVNGVLVLNLFVLFIGGYVLQIIFGKDVPEKAWSLLMVIGGILPSLSCVFMVIRREMPRPKLSSVTGWPAVFFGVLGLIIWTGFEIYFLSVIFRAR